MSEQKRLQYKSAIQGLQNLNLIFFYKDKFGELSLRKDLDNDFEFIFEGLKRADPFLDQLSSEMLDQVADAARDFYNYLVEISNWSDQDFLDKKNDIISQVTYYKNLTKKFLPTIVTYEINQKVLTELNQSNDKLIELFKKNLESLIAEHAEKIKKVEEQSSKDATSISSLKTALENEIKEINKRYANDLAGFELLKQEEIFAKTAQKNKKESYWWIVGIAVSAGVLIYMTYYFAVNCWYDFNCLNQSKGATNDTSIVNILLYYELIKRAILRFFILSILALLLKFVLKNYNALMHNFTINSHKANCFAAAFRIINSIQNENIRASILNLAGKEIFVQHKTGYLTNEETKFDLNILEKISDILSSSKKDE